jgi:glycosyltransferase involved in cell wall biosynthesis
MNDLSISVIVATLNRSHRISELIKHFDTRLDIPQGLNLEVIIIDNNSTDDTKALVTEKLSKKRGYTLRYALEKKAGVSAARNLGANIALSEWFMFLDDDALPSIDFFEKLNKEYKNNYSVSAFCFRVVSHYKHIPDWYPNDEPYKLPLLGMYNLGKPSRLISENDPIPIGSGAMIRKDLFFRYGFFDEKFSYNRNKFILVQGEDTLLFSNIMSSGESFYYIDDCIIDHYPEHAKMTFGYLSRIYLGKGFYLGFREYEETSPGGMTSYILTGLKQYKEFFTLLVRLLYSILSRNRSGSYYYYFYFIRTLVKCYAFLPTWHKHDKI